MYCVDLPPLRDALRSRILFPFVCCLPFLLLTACNQTSQTRNELAFGNANGQQWDMASQMPPLDLVSQEGLQTYDPVLRTNGSNPDEPRANTLAKLETRPATPLYVDRLTRPFQPVKRQQPHNSPPQRIVNKTKQDLVAKVPTAPVQTPGKTALLQPAPEQQTQKPVKSKLPKTLPTPVNFVKRFEIDTLPTWPSLPAKRAQTQRLNKKVFLKMKTSRGPGVPVFRVQGSYVQLASSQHGFRWVRRYDVLMQPKKCITGKNVRVGGLGSSAVSSGLSTGNIVCK